MESVETIYDYLLKGARVNFAPFQDDIYDTQIDLLSIRIEASEYHRIGFSVIDNALVFTGKGLMERFRASAVLL